ncbi:MAG: putative hydro-lyase [Quisquiliibacterium sp.]
MNAPAFKTTTSDDGIAARARARAGYNGPTAGIARGYVQANLVILPAQYATDFHRFCQANPRPCPVLGISERGSPALPSLAENIDLRFDLPRYRVWIDGKLVDEPTQIESLWQDDFVAFAIGCSFSFEEALIEAGLELRHQTEACNVPMYRTSIPAVPAGRFSGPLVVSMRPFNAADAIRAIQITSRFPAVHGAPVHLGDPSRIGIADIAKPDYGDAVSVRDGEMPVFWGCGVTPQAALQSAGIPLVITHAPGCMLVTDLRNSSLSTL